MDSGAENELESENSLSSSPRPQRKNITLKLKSDKGGSSNRGRSRKKTQKKSEDPGQQAAEEDVLETPIFKTMEPGVPLHHNNKLRWDHKVNLIGEKVVDPLIHCCEKCSLPILIYGRMIQCKHVFCFTCAKKTEKTCPRCGDPVQRIEQSALGTVFLCTYGGSKHGNNGCRRTYLSQRDLNAHIGHRHLKTEVLEQTSKPTTSQRAAVSSQQSKAAVTPAQIQASQQALMEQFSAAVRQASAATTSSLPARTGPEDIYQHHAQMSHMQQQQQHQLLSTSHPGQPQMMAGPQPTPSFAPVHTQLPPGMAQMSVQMSAPPSMMSQSSVVSSTNQDSYASSIPVVGNRIKTLISVPLQDDTDYSKQQPQGYQSMQQVNYPPPSMGQYNPVVSMAPNFGQPPPGVPPPMFSTQSLPGQLQGPAYTAPLSQSMSAIQRGPPPQMSQGPPRGPQGPPRGPPPQISPGLPRGPPTMTAPQGGPPQFFDQAQGQRGPWTRPPQAPPPSRAPRPRGPQPAADYNYY